MIREGLATWCYLLAASSVAIADAPVAYIDASVSAGGPSPAQARDFAQALVRRAGFGMRFAEPGVLPCGDDGPCLAAHARDVGATIGLRLTLAEIGDQIVASILVADSAGMTTRRQMVSGVDLDHPDDALVAALRGENAKQDGPPTHTVARVGVLTGVLGIASAGTGIYFGLRARADWDQITSLSRDRGTWNDHYASLESDAHHSTRLATITVIGGATGVLAGAVLWYLGSRRDREHPSMVVVPTADGARGSVTWLF